MNEQNLNDSQHEHVQACFLSLPRHAHAAAAKMMQKNHWGLMICLHRDLILCNHLVSCKQIHTCTTKYICIVSALWSWPLTFLSVFLLRHVYWDEKSVHSIWKDTCSKLHILFELLKEKVWYVCLFCFCFCLLEWMDSFTLRSKQWTCWCLWTSSSSWIECSCSG